MSTGSYADQYVSLWLEEALADERDISAQAGQTQLELPSKKVDIAIVGGGFTGLWSAIRLLEKEPQLSVCVLEAQYCGYGASGRNGGIAEASWPKFPVMRRLYGQGEALRLATAVEAGIGELRAFCDQHDIDAQIRHQGNLWVASNRSQIGSWDNAVEAAESAGVNRFKRISADQTREWSGSPLVLGGVYEENAASIQPARLVRGLRRVAAQIGTRICEHTPMMRYEGTGPVTVTTPRGKVLADKVILAMNAWAASYKHVKPYIFVTSSDIIATQPFPDLDANGVGSGIALSDSRRLISYWRSTPDGRIVFGKGGGQMSRGNHINHRFTGASAFHNEVSYHFRRLYPQLRDIPVDQSWCGPIDYSSSGLPYFGPLDDANPAVLTGLGFSGMGVVQTVLGGHILAALALGRDNEYTSLPLTQRWPDKLPPDPFRSIGAPIVKAAITRKERLLDAEFEPDKLTESLANLDPTAGPSQS